MTQSAWDFIKTTSKMLHVDSPKSIANPNFSMVEVGLKNSKTVTLRPKFVILFRRTLDVYNLEALAGETNVSRRLIEQIKCFLIGELAQKHFELLNHKCTTKHVTIWKLMKFLPICGNGSKRMRPCMLESSVFNWKWSIALFRKRTRNGFHILKRNGNSRK